ncbi:hypothetical protein [Paraburkholderia sp. CI3]|uniref:hypothetical protein n=1 Tax=Paraburkholderia sp. CI3 TaxID=2991060 RepID=UPI003D19B1C9
MTFKATGLGRFFNRPTPEDPGAGQSDLQTPQVHEVHVPAALQELVEKVGRTGTAVKHAAKTARRKLPYAARTITVLGWSKFRVGPKGMPYVDVDDPEKPFKVRPDPGETEQRTKGPQHVRHLESAAHALAAQRECHSVPSHGPLRRPQKGGAESTLHALERAQIDEEGCSAWLADLFGDAATSPAQRRVVAQDMLNGLKRIVGRQSGSQPLEQVVVLAQALHAACHADANAAREAVATLPDCAPPRAGHARPAAQPGNIAAWHAVQLLSRSGIGRDVLKSLAARRAPIRLAPVSADAAQLERATQRRCDALRIYIEARDYLVETAQVDFTVTPSVLKKKLDELRLDPECTLAVDALHAAQTLFHQPSRHAAALTVDEQTAYFSWFQGYQSSAPGSELAKVQARLHKIGRWLERAQRRESARYMAAPTVIGKNKTPYDAVFRFGMGGAHLQWGPLERNHFDEAVGAAMNIAIERLRNDIRHTADASHLTRLAVPLARLECWQAASHGNRPRALECDDNAVAEVRDRALHIVDERLAAPNPPALSVAARLKLTHDAVANRDPFDLEMLEKLDTDLKLFGPAVDAQDAQHAAYQTNLNTAKHIRAGRPITAARTFDGLKAGIHEVIDDLILGSEVAFNDGGMSGIDTSNLYLNFLWGSVRPIVTLMGGRIATFSIEGDPSTGGVLKFGSAQKVKLAAGVGVFGSASLPLTPALSVYAGAEGSAQASVDTTLFTGVRVRALKQVGPDGKDDGKWRDQLRRVNDFILNHAEQSRVDRAVKPERLWAGLAQTFFDEPGLSIGWVDERNVSPQVSATLAAGAKLRVNKWSAGPGVSTTVTWKPHDRARVRNTGGTRQVNSATDGTSISVGLGEAFGVSPSSIQLNDKVSLSPGSIPIWSRSTEVYRNEQMVSVRETIGENGRVMPDKTYRDMIHSSFETHEQMVHDNWDAWVHARGSAQSVNAHLKEVKSSLRPNQNFGERWTMHPAAAKRLDTYAARAAFLRARIAAKQKRGARSASAAMNELREIDAQREKLFADPQSWIPFCIFSYEATTDGRTVTLPLPGLSITSTTNAVTVRENDVSFAPSTIIGTDKRGLA